MSQSVDQQELETVEKFHSDVAAITREIRKTIVGQQEAVDQVLVSLLTGSNSMITGVPGLAKTLLISTVAEVLALKIQPDSIHAGLDARRHHRHRDNRRRSGDGAS